MRQPYSFALVPRMPSSCWVIRLLPALLALPCLVAPSHAQPLIRFGPRVGLSRATAVYMPFAGTQFEFTPTSLSGVEAGVVAEVSRRHWGLQAGASYAEKGLVLHGLLKESARYQGGIVRFQETLALHYLSFPLQLVYSARATGQGWQAFGGGYIARLVGGHYQVADTYEGHDEVGFTAQMPVRAGKEYDTSGSFRVQPLDAGVQAGLGYRCGGVLLQVAYSAGLRNLDVTYPGVPASRESRYYSRTWQASVAYLFSGRPAAAPVAPAGDRR